ncbi:hypothetical protein PanWU01x14_353030 [Parasponia andersonii]|uniref:Uncharacterized protein n=1 Tax=Parasponia andersonii TaxID=3476 RepID=A0A2P5AA45_PARAD|nr:hypothetical protein PanWU01x14_353030 [Parasponia andersonii]
MTLFVVDLEEVEEDARDERSQDATSSALDHTKPHGSAVSKVMDLSPNPKSYFALILFLSHLTLIRN